MTPCLLASMVFNCTLSQSCSSETRQSELTDCSLPAFPLTDTFLFCPTAIAYVLVGSGLYDEAIRHFSTMLQVMFPSVM